MLPCRLPSKKAKGSHQTASRKRGRRAVYGIYAFSLLCENTGYIPKWGMLTGIRPSKLFRGFAERYGEEKAKKYSRTIISFRSKRPGLRQALPRQRKKQSLCRAPILSAFTSQYRSARRGAVTAHLYRIQRKQRVQRKQFPSMLSSYVRSFA